MDQAGRERSMEERVGGLDCYRFKEVELFGKEAGFVRGKVGLKEGEGDSSNAR